MPGVTLTGVHKTYPNGAKAVQGVDMKIEHGSPLAHGFGERANVLFSHSPTFTLQAGEFAKEPVETQFGWHVIKVEERRETAPPAFEEVADQVRQVVMRERYGDLIRAARSETEIEVLDPSLKEAYDAVSQQQQ